eukprot:Ihof_evm2s550 gene=Ihof_evmTU2s550
MLHAMKKAVGAYKTAKPVTDPIYDLLYQQYKDINTHATNLEHAFQNIRSTYTAINVNVKLATDAVKGVYSESPNQAQPCNDRAKQLADSIAEAMVNWNSDIEGLREGRGKEGQVITVTRGERILKEYICLLVKTRSSVKRRGDLVKEVDYYRGKEEELVKAGSRKSKDEERLRATQATLNSKEDAYNISNAECKDLLQQCVDLKDDVFLTALTDYARFQQLALSLDPFKGFMQNYQDILNSPLNDLKDMQPPSRKMSAANPPLMAGVNVPESYPPPPIDGVLPPLPQPEVSGDYPPPGIPGPVGIPLEQANQSYVTALYDFTAENPNELSFFKGDRILLLEVLDKDWMAGQINDK